MKKLLLVVLLTGCATGSGSKYLLDGGWFGGKYTPPPTRNRFSDGTFKVTIDAIRAGGFNKDFGIDVTVRNVSMRPERFDPGEVEVTVPETGISYFHVSKDRSHVTLPAGWTVLLPTTLRPGQAVKGLLWYQTPMGAAKVKSLDVSYRGATFKYPAVEEEVAED
jgi:hypothetical protein